MKKILKVSFIWFLPFFIFVLIMFFLNIVKKDFKHFKSGDVLKPAGWAAPALNSPRGNVLKGNYPMQWTGPLYLN